MSLPPPRVNRPLFSSSRVLLQNGDRRATFSSAKCGALASASLKQRNITLDLNSNEVSKKNHAEGNDSSLPGSPDSLPDIDGLSCSAAVEALEADTKRLVSAFLSDLVRPSSPLWSEDRVQITMKRVVSDLLEKHRYMYNGILNKLKLDEREGDMTFVTTVARSMFSDGITNWGRVASLVAFGASVCLYLKEQKQRDCVSVVSHEISSYLLTEQRDWLIQNNCWDGFVEFFRVSDPESTVRGGLMAVAGVLGVGAALAMFLR